MGEMGRRRRYFLTVLVIILCKAARLCKKLAEISVHFFHNSKRDMRHIFCWKIEQLKANLLTNFPIDPRPWHHLHSMQLNQFLIIIAAFDLKFEKD